MEDLELGAAAALTDRYDVPRSFEELRETKRLLREIAGRPIDNSVVQRTIECIAEARVSSEGVEGIRALLASEKPRWSRE